MSTNPYAPPTSTTSFDVAANPANDELARRFTRFASALVDGFLVMAVLGPLAFATGFFARTQAQQVGLPEQILMSLAGMAVMLLLNGYLLATRGQTIGKVLTKIQIVDAQSGKLLPFHRVFIFRYLWITPFSLGVILIPGPFDDLLVNALSLIDALFIFGAARRCLHDYIAGSKVVLFKPDRAKLT